MALNLICVATLATAVPLTALKDSAGKKESEFDNIWETTMRQGIKCKMLFIINWNCIL